MTYINVLVKISRINYCYTTRGLTNIKTSRDTDIKIQNLKLKNNPKEYVICQTFPKLDSFEISALINMDRQI